MKAIKANMINLVEVLISLIIIKIMSTSDNTRIKRQFIISSCTIGVPLIHIIRNRNEIYRSTRIMKEFHLKEVMARTFLGFFIGFAVATYFYGVGPRTAE